MLEDKDTMVHLQWHCSTTLGIKSSPYGDYEIECDCDFDTYADKDEYLEESVSATCPSCGNELWQSYDEPHVIED
jgi:hypothetical protein